MVLGLFKLTNGQGQISADETYSNPATWETSPTGGTLETRYYLRMDNANVEYLTDGRLYAVDVVGEDESGWFTFAPDEAGGPGEYASDFEFELELEEEVPVWIRVQIPSGIDTEPKDDIKLTCSYIGHETE